MNKNYKEQLADNRWLRKKTEILIRDNYTCQKCGATSYLNVHHINYEKGKLAWEYPDDNLITLCRDCHERTHIEQNSATLNAINRGDWYYTYLGDFCFYGIIFEIDYMLKNIYIFGTEEGAWGSPWIYIVKYDDFDKWRPIEGFEPNEWDVLDDDVDYILKGFTTAFDELMKGEANIMGTYPVAYYGKEYAQHYIPIYISRTKFIRDYCDFNNIKYDYNE